MEKRIVCVTIVLLTMLTLGPIANAQRGGNTAWTKYRHEASIGYGMNNLFANLGERDSPVFNTVFQRSTFNASYRYYFLKHFAARGSISHAYARKNDKAIESEPRENVRLDYISTLTEFSALAEYHIIDETTKGRRGRVRRARGGVSKGLNVGVSFFGGIAFSHFRPYAEYFGDRVVFKPISDPLPVNNTASYSRNYLMFPVGGQVRILVNENWRVGFEAGYRLGIKEYMNYVSGVYSEDPEKEYYTAGVDDPSYVGKVTFAKEQTPIGQLVSEKGKRNYFFGLVTLSYRFKS